MRIAAVALIVSLSACGGAADPPSIAELQAECVSICPGASDVRAQFSECDCFCDASATGGGRALWTFTPFSAIYTGAIQDRLRQEWNAFRTAGCQK